MYYYLNGKLAYRDPNFCVVDCGGVGYTCTVSLNTSSALANKLNEDVKLYTHLAVREDGIELFGFGSESERACFNQLTSVSGVGPKAAMSILSVMTPDKFSLAVCTEDTKAISKAPGIGAKTAARIVLELKDKVSKDMMGTELKQAQIPTDISAKGPLSEAAEALMVLGYDRNTVMHALAKIPEGTNDVGQIIKLALKSLAF